MNFKQALIAHLQGERVEVFTQFPAYDKTQDGQYKWRSFGDVYSSFEVGDTDDYSESSGAEYRLAPRTIMCNGVEVVAGEKEEPEKGRSYYIPIGNDASEHTWGGYPHELHYLKIGIVYLDRFSCIARAKAMLIVQEVK